METGMIIIATVLFAIILVPTILLIKNTKKHSKRLLNGLNAAAAQKNGTISEHLEARHFALGLDTQNKALYFFKKTEEDEITQIVDLNSVASCAVEKRTKRIKTDKTGYEIVESVALLFTQAKGHEFEKLELYNDKDNFQLNGELVVAETYKKKVMALLSQPAKTLEVKQGQNLAMELS